MTVKYSFITFSFGEGRLKHAKVLLASLKQFSRNDVEFLIVEKGSRFLENTPYRYIPVSSDESYNRALCLDAGARAARGEFLILHDIDIPLPSGFFDNLDRMADRYRYFSTYNEIHHLTEEDTDRVFSHPEKFRYGYYGFTGERMRRFGGDVRGGSSCIHREIYFACGGMNPAFTVWGGEDEEFHVRANLLSPCGTPETALVHLYHLPADRDPPVLHADPRYIKNVELLAKTHGDPRGVIKELKNRR
uniref:N-terminal domain of galactosyltransferase n=1 Tax=Candidatus Kentrum sp. DK TaxID=2126562 RepID=A0A450SQ12_9GAMM|nr:MAG: N-terminal domain of galactosyltransferase [Candidatus Kentron sp. DK]